MDETISTSSQPRAIWNRLEAVVFLVALIVIFVGTQPKLSAGDTANSRLATVYALAEQGTWTLDPESNPFEAGTVDKVMVDDRLLSSKPPILPLAMTAEYVVMRAVLGWDLNQEADRERIVSTMSLTLIGLPFLLAMLAFFLMLRLIVPEGPARFVGLLVFTFGTQMLPYATHINNHVPAASLLAIAYYFAIGLATGRHSPAPWRFFAFGISGALACTIDLPAVFLLVPIGLLLLYRFPKATLQGTGVGVALPLLLHFGLTYAITGSPIPIQLHKDWYLYERSYWRNPRGVDALNEPAGTYLFHMTFGRSGLFSLFPVLVISIMPLFLKRKNADDDLTRIAWLVAAGFACLTAFYVYSTNNYGGESYGFRWYIIAAPVLTLLVAIALRAIARPWQWVVVAALLCVSMFSAWECSQNPWKANTAWTTKIFGPSL